MNFFHPSSRLPPVPDAICRAFGRTSFPGEMLHCWYNVRGDASVFGRRLPGGTDTLRVPVGWIVDHGEAALCDLVVDWLTGPLPT